MCFYALDCGQQIFQGTSGDSAEFAGESPYLRGEGAGLPPALGLRLFLGPANASSLLCSGSSEQVFKDSPVLAAPKPYLTLSSNLRQS